MDCFFVREVVHPQKRDRKHVKGKKQPYSPNTSLTVLLYFPLAFANRSHMDLFFPPILLLPSLHLKKLNITSTSQRHYVLLNRIMLNGCDSLWRGSPLGWNMYLQGFQSFANTQIRMQLKIRSLLLFLLLRTIAWGEIPRSRTRGSKVMHIWRLMTFRQIASLKHVHQHSLPLAGVYIFLLSFLPHPC